VRGDIIRFETLISTVNTPVNDDTSGDTEHQVLTEYELRQVERKNIIRALQYCDGRVFGKGGAAEMLELKPTTLSSRIKKLKINKD
jgi:transcriptional regulator with GAF, ATPase, and Fis domain